MTFSLGIERKNVLAYIERLNKMEIRDEILIRYIKQSCSKEEAREVLRWIEASEENKAHFEQLYAIWIIVEMEAFSEITDVPEDVLEGIRMRASVPSGKKRRRQLYWIFSTVTSVAAVVLFVFFLNRNKNVQPDYETYLSKVASSTEIVLAIGEEEAIEIQDSMAVVSYDTQKRRIQINDTLEIEQKQKEETLNTIRIPYGKRSLLVLADGTRVHLNSGSSLVYPSNFTGDKREVYLEGEGYFEVQKEADERKFLVHTAYKTIEVTGTQFDVLIDKTLQKFEAVLVSGKIAVDSEAGTLQLTPKQCYNFSADTRNEDLKEVDVSNYISWIDGKLKFDRLPLHEVLYKLEKVYNIKITLVNPEYLDYQVSGMLDLRNTGEETLDILMGILVPGGKVVNLYQIN